MKFLWGYNVSDIVAILLIPEVNKIQPVGDGSKFVYKLDESVLLRAILIKSFHREINIICFAEYLLAYWLPSSLPCESEAVVLDNAKVSINCFNAFLLS